MAEPKRTRTCLQRVSEHPTQQALPPKLQAKKALGNLKQPGSTHTSTNAHGNDDVFHATALAFDEGVADQAGAGGAVGVADSDGAAVDVQAVHRDAEFALAVENLNGEGFVEFPQADVVDGQAGALEQFGNGEDRADAHFVGLTTGNRETTEDTQRGSAALFGHLAVHQNTGRSTVGELAGVAGGDHAAFHRRADLADAFQCPGGCPRPG